MSNTAEFIRLVAKFDGDACSSSANTSLRLATAPTAIVKFVDTSVSGNAASGSAETSAECEQSENAAEQSNARPFIAEQMANTFLIGLLST